MGRETRNFRQTGRARTGNFQTRNNSGINRSGYWGKIFGAFKLKKGEIK